MSDLISRSELISRIESEYREYGEDYDVEQILGDIEDMPTAYSVGKVVNELEEIKDEYDHSCIDNAYQRGVQDGAKWMKKKAIEIVKQVVVSDDVCEWEKGSSGYVGYPAYYSKCCTTNSNGLEMQTHIIADWKYCPYCGKKIKVVE